MNVVITGSTRGIGFGLAREFLRRGHRVIVCGRSAETTKNAVLALTEYGAEVFGQACDVTQLEQVQRLWDAATARFGKIDIWINNAGLSAPTMLAWELPETTLRAVLEVNLLGMMHGSKVALTGMLGVGSGALYNMEGLGSDGMVLKGSVLYGATKRALRYYTRGLVKETRKTPLQVGHLSPGIVLTDLFTGGKELDARTKRFANILADRVETVTPFLAERILANKKHGARIVWLTRRKIIRRFLTARLTRRDLFSDVP